MFLTGCCETKQQKKTRLDQELQQEQEQQSETTKARILSQYPNAIPFEPKVLASPIRPLTIDVQASIGASPGQPYWSDVSDFDIHRSRNGLRLVLHGSGDHWASLECSDDLAVRVRQAYKPDNYSMRFIFVFRLTSATPLRVELRGESDGSGEDATVSIKAADIDGRFYTGTLLDFSVLDEGYSISGLIKPPTSR